MCDTYSFANDIKSLPERISVIEGTIRKLLAQTVECTMFIRECNGHGFGGKLLAIFVIYCRALHATERILFTASMTRQIDEFIQSFKALKEALTSGLAVQTSIVSFRIDETVKRIGVHCSFPFTAAY